MTNILEHLTPFTKQEPPEDIDLFVCEETDTERRYGIMRYFKKGSMLPRHYGNDGKTPEERLLEQIFHEPREEAYATTTCFYRYVKNRRSGDQDGVWVKSSINPLDSSYIAINPEDLE